jgi:3-hydroxyacyl-[acyl-carrier-protein] dehydratase
VELLILRPEGASVQGRVTAAAPGQPMSAATPVAEAEIFFAHLDQSRSQQIFGERNFVFSGELKHMLGLVKVLAGRTDGKANS